MTALRTVATGMAVLALYALPLFTVSGAQNVFLKIEGVDGESMDEGHEGWIDAAEVAYGVLRPIESGSGGPRNPGRASFSDLTFTRRIDKASPALFQAATDGRPIPLAELEFLRQSEMRERFYRIRLYDVLVSSLTQVSTSDAVTETAAVNYSKIETTYTTFDVRGAVASDTTAYYNLETAEGGVEIGTPANQPPTILPLNDVDTPEDTAAFVTVTVGDDLTPAGNLTLTAQSGNPQLVPTANILRQGSDATRTVTIIPADDASGTAIITLTVSDGALTASTSFRVNVLPVNDPPSLSSVPPQAVEAGTSLEVPFNVSDVDTPLTAVGVEAASADPTLVPATGLIVSGAGPDRVLTITPTAGMAGETEIRLLASDGVAGTAVTFILVVNVSDPRAPTAVRLSNATLPENSPPGTPVGTLMALDPDSTEHTFVLLDSAGDRFEIVGSELRAGPTPLDFESAAEHAILVQATDPDQLQFVAQLVVAVENVNESPVISVEDATLLHVVSGRSLPITQFQVADVDAGDNPLLLTLDVGQGTLAVGVTPVGVTAQGTGTAQLVLSGPITALNGLLADRLQGLRYQPPSDVNGLDQLTATLDDQGYAGSGGSLAVFTTLGIQFYRDDYARWEFDHFTEKELNDPALESTLWGLNADFDGDGLDTLAEYGYGSDPRVADRGTLLQAQFHEDGEQRWLQYTVDRRQDPKLSLTVEVGDSVEGTLWSGDQSALDTSAPTDLGNGFEQIRFTDLTPVSNARQRFMRIRWELH